MFRSYLVICVICFAGLVLAQPVSPGDYGLKSLSLLDKNLGRINYYIDTTGLNENAPVVIDINGSGGLPACMLIQGKDYSEVIGTMNGAVRDYFKSKFHYIILDKPGTSFCDTVYTENSQDSLDIYNILVNYKSSPEYDRRLSLDWRVNASKKVLDDVLKRFKVNKKLILAFGYSEGAQVSPSLAVADPRITHVAAFVGSGLNQFYDFINQYRLKEACGEMSPEEAQDRIGQELEKIKDVYAYPNATDKFYQGHTYLRWSSFCQVVVMEQLLKLTIPIFIVSGSADDSSPIHGLDYIPLEFLRKKKNNLSYHTCVGCNHGLTEIKPQNGPNHMMDYLKKVDQWLTDTSQKKKW